MTHRFGRRRIMFVVVFALLGMALCNAAIQAKTNVHFLLLSWAVSNLLIVSLAYLFDWRRVFGKTDQGSLLWPAALFMAPFLTFTHLTWWAQNFFSSSPIYGSVTSHLFVGRRCKFEDLPNGVTLVIDLTSEFATPHSVPDSVQTICVPTLDGCCPVWSQCGQAFETLKNNHGGVYICCANGCGRSVTFMAAWMLQTGQCGDVDEAIQMIRKGRPQANPNPDQLSSLQQFTAARF